MSVIHSNVLVKLLLCSLVTVTHSGEEDECILPLDPVPYITFDDQRLPNHSFVEITTVQSGTVVLQCHTDISTCCLDTEREVGDLTPLLGQWVLPNGQVVGRSITDFSVRRDAMRLDLVYDGDNGTLPPSGIYHCDIPTTAVSSSDSRARESVYVGLYSDDGKFNMMIYSYHTAV